MRGAPARAIEELAGHQDVATTQRYMHLSPAAIDGAIRLLDTPSGVVGLGNIVATGAVEIANSNSIEQVRWWRRRESNSEIALPVSV